MARYIDSLYSLGRKPGAYVPIAMSLIALAVLLTHLLAFGVVRESDEGAAAHLWQLLMAGQLPIAACFLIRWFPRAPGCTSSIVALQVCAALVATAPVYWLGW